MTICKDIKYEKNGIKKFAHERFKAQLEEVGWRVVENIDDKSDGGDMTKSEIMKNLDKLQIKYNKLDKKTVLLDLLKKTLAEKIE